MKRKQILHVTETNSDTGHSRRRSKQGRMLRLAPAPATRSRTSFDRTKCPAPLSSPPMISRRRAGALVPQARFTSRSRYIIALCRGAFYKVEVVSADGTVLIADEALLEKRFNEIIAHAATAVTTEKGSVGSLTTVNDRQLWETQRARLAAAASSNVDNLAAVDDALLVVTLDDTVSGLSPEEMERSVLYGLEGTVQNRWLDKWNVIVTGDGQAGMNWEHSMLDGHTIMEFFEPVAHGVVDYSDSGEGPAMLTEADPEATVIEPLEWVMDSDTEAAIEASLAKSASCGVETLEYTDFGTRFITGNKCSPDGFAQAAMMLTFVARAPKHSSNSKQHSRSMDVVERPVGLTTRGEWRSAHDSEGV